MNKTRLLNLGCGNRYHKDWVNADIRSSSREVLALDLTKQLPFEDESFYIVYHSHLLEHFPNHFAQYFLTECFRILESGGILRVVVPDFERMARIYLELLARSLEGNEIAQKQYEWIMLEMFDQMVRNQSGGEMLKYWQQNPMPAEDFVIERVGSEVLDVIKILRNAPMNSESTAKQKESDDPGKIGTFRVAGEVHQWMYDRFSLKCLLEKAGFVAIKQCRADESSIPDFNSYLLDIEKDGSVRKPDSLFMEAVKPHSA